MPALGAPLLRRAAVSSLRRSRSLLSSRLSGIFCFRGSQASDRHLFLAGSYPTDVASASFLSTIPPSSATFRKNHDSLNDHLLPLGARAIGGGSRRPVVAECTSVRWSHQCSLVKETKLLLQRNSFLTQRRLSNALNKHVSFTSHGLFVCRALSSSLQANPPSKDVKVALPPAPPADSFAAIEAALDSVVKVFTVSSSPNYFLPWQNKSQREVTGSGFVISGKRIITNAHVVADQTFVKVRKHGSPEKFKAQVKAVGHECDLALLTVEKEEFWDGMKPLELGNIPFLQEAVAVVGYPQGGDNISVTGGVVSRVEPTQYVHCASHLMAIQIDAAINPGNSGGPALMEDKVVGVAFQNLANAENIGYIIPVPIINHFLEDVEEKGKYVGFCTLGLTCQATENAHLRDHLKMPKGMTGVLVNKIHPLTDTHRWIKNDDVVLAFDSCPIANDGTVRFRNRERITFDHLVSMKKAGETGLVRVLRNGKELEFMIKLGPIRPLVPIHQFDQLPSFLIFAGFVFTPLTQPYLHEYGDEWYNASPRRLCDRAMYAIPKKFGEQIVILSQVLVDDINIGYERLAELQVKKVNGEAILNLRHLRQLVDDCKETRIRFDLEDGRVVVLNYQAAKEASVRILERHRIPFLVSKDLQESPELDLEDWEKADDSCEDVAEIAC